MAIYRGSGGATDTTDQATIDEVTEQAGAAAASATAAASSASSASTSASNAATSASQAATSATSASTSASQATSSKNAAATSATAAEAAKVEAEAAQAAAENAEANAITYGTNAVSANTTAQAAKTAAETARDVASGYKDTAVTKASEAAASATAAATSASSASTSATSAAASASAAATTAAESEATLQAIADSVKSFYLGAEASAPTVDDNGDALTAGDWYFNTTDSQTYIYNGSSWDAVSPDLVGDTTPQLGGDLDLNGNNITGTGNINVTGTATINSGASTTVLLANTTQSGGQEIILADEDGGIKLRNIEGELELRVKGAGDTGDNAKLGLRIRDSNDVYLYDSAGTTPKFIWDSSAANLDITGTITTDGLTTSGDITFGDNDKAIFGAGSDLQIYHDGSHSRIKNTTGYLYISDTNGDVYIQAKDGENSIYAGADGPVYLYYDNALKLSTTSTGIDVTGEITADGIALGDNQKATFGASDDLQIYHDGARSYVDDTGVGSLWLRGGDVAIMSTADESMATFANNGAAKIYYDGSEKLATTSTGIDVTGTATMDGAEIAKASAMTQLKLERTTTAAGSGYLGASADHCLVAQDSAGLYRAAVHQNGDLSLYENTGTTAKFFWDASAETLTLDNASSTYGLDITGQGNGDRGMRVKNETDGTAARSNLRIENAGGIGANLLYPAASYTGVSGWANRLIISLDGASNGVTLRGAEIRLTGDDSLHNPDLVVTSSGNVGIGTSSPAFYQGTGLEIERAGIATLRLQNTTLAKSAELKLDTDLILESINSGSNIRFNTVASERMRLDASGNLLVGTTSGYATIATTSTESGHVLSPTAGYAVSRAGAPILGNRYGSDGTIVDLRKDGTAVGSIANDGSIIRLAGTTASGGGVFLADGTTNVAGFVHGENAWRPAGDNTINLGKSDRRFKDLYLSGGVYLGGTGAANHLQDYEEGEWEPVITCGSGSVTVNASNKYATYTKVGQLVNVSGKIYIDSVSTPSGSLALSLPFTVKNGTGLAASSVVYGYITISASTHTPCVIEITDGQATMQWRKEDWNLAAGELIASSRISFNFSYVAA